MCTYIFGCKLSTFDATYVQLILWAWSDNFMSIENISVWTMGLIVVKFYYIEHWKSQHYSDFFYFIENRNSVSMRCVKPDSYCTPHGNKLGWVNVRGIGSSKFVICVWALGLSDTGENMTFFTIPIILQWLIRFGLTDLTKHLSQGWRNIYIHVLKCRTGFCILLRVFTPIIAKYLHSYVHINLLCAKEDHGQLSKTV